MAMDSQRRRARLGRLESRVRIVAAASELIRERGYARLGVGDVMERAGIGRTLFYRHFDDLGDLLLKSSSEAIEALFASEVELSAAAEEPSPNLLRSAIEPAVVVYSRHGPLLQALAEAAPGDARIAAAQEEIRKRFDALVVDVLTRLPRFAGRSPDEIAEIARALNLLNTAYLLDAFGREPRIDDGTALDTLSGIWLAVVGRTGPGAG